MTALLTEGRLKNHPFLKDAKPAFLNQLEEFEMEANFVPGEIILREGEYADHFYLIHTGEVTVESKLGEASALAVQKLGPGDLLGWSWLFPPFQWHSTVRATRPCVLSRLPGAALLVRAEEDPAFGYELMKRVSACVIQRLHATRASLAKALASAG